ncbi:MAG: M48 family metallopeptidase [bacterium]
MNWPMNWPMNWIVGIFLVLFAAKWLVENGLLWLNLAHVRRAGASVPPALAGRIEPEAAAKSARYTLARGRFGFLRGLFGAALALVLLFSGVMPWLDRVLSGGAGPLPPLDGILLSAVFLIVLGAASSLAGLPFSLYGTFAIEERFGFNRQTVRGWIADRLKGLAVAAVLGLPLLWGVLAFMAHAGRWWWLWVFAFVTAYQLLLVWIVPTWIAPLFNKFSPLADLELKERLETLAKRAGFRTRGLYTMDASRRTGHSNAYFTGLGRTKRIVLFDTMLDRLTHDQTLSVLAHEIGHYRLRHIARRLALGVGTTLVMLYVLSLLERWPALYAAFGFAGPSHHALLALVALGGGAFTFYLSPLAAWYSRRHEYEADAYAVELARMPGALKSALVEFSDQNLSNLNPHPWYSAYYYSHPALPQRLAAIDGAAVHLPPAQGAGES